MFRYPDGAFNCTTPGRPVSSLSSKSSSDAAPIAPGSCPHSGPPSPTFQLGNYLQWVERHQRKKDSGSRSMGTDFQFPPQRMQQELLAFHESTFATINARQAAGKKSPKPDSYKTVMCQAWLESKVCSFAENCRFAHGEAELRLSKIAPKQNSKYKTKLCDKYTTTGLCPYGSRCLFIHPDNGNNAYIRPDKLVEVNQRYALTDINNQKVPQRPVTPDADMFSSRRPQLRPHPSWPLEPANFFSDKNEDEGQPGLNVFELQSLFGCFDSTTTPNRVSIASGLSGYGSGGSSPFSTSSSSSVNLSSSDDEQTERDYFRNTGLEHLAEELTRNLTTTELF